MADVEMDLDTRNHGDVVHAHDDPIDYDLDIDITTDQEPTWDAEDVDIQEAADELPDVIVQMEEPVYVDHDFPSDAMDTLEAGVTASVAKSDADMLSNVDPNEINTMDHAIEQDQEDMTSGDLETTAIVETTVATPKLHAEEAHDPDYLELSDLREEEPDEITYEEVEPVPKENAGADANTEEAGPVGEAVNEPQEPVGAQGNDAVNDELTWEEEDVEKDHGMVESKQAKGDERTEFDFQVQSSEDNAQQTAPEQVEKEENEQVENLQTEEHAVAGEAEAVDDLNHEAPQPQQEALAAIEEVQDEAVEAHEVQDPPGTGTLVDATEPAETTGHDGAENDNQGESSGQHAESDEALTKDGYWPAITVQYKGEEFPCFAAADGFFTQTSVVEESMEKLLAGLRLELAAELAEDEELVFHVDELGLEFAESTQQDLLSTTTLRSILDLYEMLIQNQDQDAHAKPLYTYLFTRSSPCKRLEYLMESAANGRGLDEVIHLFEPAILHSHETSHDGDSDIMEDDHGEYPSPGDELQAAEEEAIASYGVGDTSRSEEAGAKAIDHTESSTQNDHGAGEATTTYDEFGDQANNAFEGLVAEVSVEATNAATELEDPGLQEEREEMVQYETEQPEVIVPFEIIDDQHQDENEQDSAIILHDGSADNEEKTATGDTVVESSATSTTLDGTEPAVDDLTYNEQSNEDVHAMHDVEDDLAEIDWKDDDDEDTVPVTEQSPSAKRTRAEDELDETEENDTKRQRSS